jgi:hypothetical protein
MQVMERNNSEKLLKKFFAEQKQEIPDNGFSKNILSKLPEQPKRNWIVWTFAYLGMAISLLIAYNSGLLQHVLSSIIQLPFYYYLGAVFSFPFLGSIGFYLSQKKIFA